MSLSVAPIAEIAPGAGGLPKLTLTAPDGARAEIYLYGGHIVSWKPAGDVDRLFLSRTAAFEVGMPIRGGIPVAFPQFGVIAVGGAPLLTQHGLARLMNWECVGTEAAGEEARALLQLTDTPESRTQWDHAFLAQLALAVGGNRLSVTLTVTNTGETPFDFTAALHTYFAVTEAAETKVEGLAGLRYRDATAGGVELTDSTPAVTFPSEVNRIYFDAPPVARIVEPERSLLVEKRGFRDVVTWNPGAARCATIPDLEPEDYRRFICVEAVAVGAPVHVGPGESWVGAQILRA